MFVTSLRETNQLQIYMQLFGFAIFFWYIFIFKHEEPFDSGLVIKNIHAN